jgi:hypothetical protein
MRRRASLREKAFVVGAVLLFAGLAGVLVAGPHQTLIAASRYCLIFGWIVSTCAYFVRVWDRNPAIRRIKKDRQGVSWLGILAILLWVIVLPVACLWVYGYIHQR